MFAVICNGKHFPRKTQTPTELCRFIWSADFKASKTTAACAVTSSEGRRLGDGRYYRGQETLAALSRFVDFLSVPSLLSSLFPPFWPRQRHSLLPPLCPCQRHSLLPPLCSRQRHSRLAWGKQQFWTECLSFWGGESLFLYPFFAGSPSVFLYPAALLV